MHNWLDTFLEFYIAVILTCEYFLGRSDLDLKKEEKRRQAKKSKILEPTPLSRGGNPPDVVLVPRTSGSVKEGETR